jgi:hypothetical protein
VVALFSNKNAKGKAVVAIGSRIFGPKCEEVKTEGYHVTIDHIIEFSTIGKVLRSVSM